MALMRFRQAKPMSKFQGFTEPNTTQSPNQFYDFVMPDIDNLAELKCILYVIRRTYGFLKFVDRIAYSQFEKGIITKDGKQLDKGIGMSGPSVMAGLNKAVEHGYINRYVVCPSCQSEVKERSAIEYCMKPRQGKPVQIRKDVAPAKCPFCQNELRGKEEIYYSLNFLDSPGLDYLRGLVGATKTFRLGLSNLFSTQDKDNTKEREQEKEEQKKDTFSSVPLSPRERTLNDLSWLLETEVPDDDYLYKPWEKALDSIASGTRKILGKRTFDDDCARAVHGAIESLARKRGGYPLKDATSPTRPVIELVLKTVKNGNEQAQARSELAEAAARSQQLLAERQAARRPPTDDELWWGQVLDTLKLQMDAPVFDRWLKPTRLLQRGNGTVRVGVKDATALDWIDNRLRRLIERSLVGFGVSEVEFELLPSGGESP